MIKDSNQTIVKSIGTTPTEKYLSKLCERTFLKLWSYPNPYRKHGKELCDLIAVFENHVFLFFDRHSLVLFNDRSDIQLAWSRWKKEAIDKQIRSAKKARGHLIRNRNEIFLDSKCQISLPVNLPEGELIIHTIIVAHGSSEICLAFAEANISGSLAISYTDNTSISSSLPFFVNLTKEEPVHILDSNTAGIILSELDTFSDFVEFISAKERAIEKYDFIAYCGEEDLLAHYYHNFDETSKKHFIGVNDQSVMGISISEGEWQEFIKSSAYNRKKEADKISYFWDELLQRTAQHALEGNLIGDGGVFSAKSAIYEMAKEPRFSRRALSTAIIKAIQNFPGGREQIIRNLNFMPSYYEDTGYIFLQIHYPNKDTIDYEKDYRPKRREILNIACGVAKNRFPKLKRIVGIAIDAPKYSRTNSEDFLLMICDDWPDERARLYEELNKDYLFFKSPSQKVEKIKVSNFPAESSGKIIKSFKIGRNSTCPCGSGKKFKKCHGAVQR